jgi:hypothetical protein
VARYFSISDQTAEAAGFPAPMHGARVRDRNGRVWTYNAHTSDGLSDLSGSWIAPVVGGAGSIGGGIIGNLIGGAAGGAVGGGIALLSSLIAGIFGAHAAKSAREDEISGAWAASGPAAIQAVMDAYHSGQISATDASSALGQIQQQFYAMTQPISKLNGKFGAFPDPNAARPSGDCNWACGTSWDLNKQINSLKSQLIGGGTGGLNLGALTGDPIMLGGLAVIAVLMFSGGKGRR